VRSDVAPAGHSGEGPGGDDLPGCGYGNANTLTGNAGAAGNSFSFFSFGTAAQGATLPQIGATNQSRIHSGLGGADETITLLNGASVDASDMLFV
jgi:hypothetical protein